MLPKAATLESIFVSGSLFIVLYAKFRITGFRNPSPMHFLVVTQPFCDTKWICGLENVHLAPRCTRRAPR